MTDTTAQEPTMEEILASIRRIISEDDTPAPEAAPAAAAASAPAAPPAAAPAAAAPEPTPPAMELMPSIQEDPTVVEDEEILDLTDRYEAPASETIGDLDVAAAAEPEPEPFPTSFSPEPEPVSHDPAPSESSVDYDNLVSDAAAASAASAFAGLSASFRPPEPTPTGGTGPTIDDLARALLRPMLKEWLDANLPGIVETAVRKEVERISRSA